MLRGGRASVGGERIGAGEEHREQKTELFQTEASLKTLHPPPVMSAAKICWSCIMRGIIRLLAEGADGGRRAEHVSRSHLKTCELFPFQVKFRFLYSTFRILGP